MDLACARGAAPSAVNTLTGRFLESAFKAHFSLQSGGGLCYTFCVTEHISIRPRRPGLKAELARKAKPNINAWLNDLIERELAAQPNDWREILERDRPVARNEVFAQCLKPE